MVSRRKILSRSRDDLNLDRAYMQQQEEEDVWYQKEKLFKVRESFIQLSAPHAINISVSGAFPRINSFEAVKLIG